MEQQRQSAWRPLIGRHAPCAEHHSWRRMRKPPRKQLMPRLIRQFSNFSSGLMVSRVELDEVPFGAMFGLEANGACCRVAGSCAAVYLYACKCSSPAPVRVESATTVNTCIAKNVLKVWRTTQDLPSVLLNKVSTHRSNFINKSVTGTAQRVVSSCGDA
jgi:hypothetical protein